MTKGNDIDDLIGKLSEELKPVKPMAHPLIQAIPYVLISFAYMAVVVFYVGIRGDWEEKLGDAPFMLEIFMMGFLAVSAMITAIYLTIPDMRGDKWILAIPFTLLASFFVMVFIRSFTEGVTMPKIHYDHCMGEGGYMTIIPLAVLLFLTKRGATTRPYLSALMTIFAIAGLGYVGLRFTCSMDTIGHAVISHMIPYIVIGSLLGIGAKKIYKW
ncbi:MAG: DUF1109 family protein [Alphaproteobacteria bacterium]|nr:DUF1109 family protein [Alphaproteobacteria bacterium]